MLDGGRVGVVYDDYDNFGDLTDKVLSQTLSGAFDSWPPKVGPLVTHYAGMLWNAPWWLSARAEGVFAVSGGNMSGIFRFDDPTPIVVDPFLRTYLLEPEAGGGAYVVDHSTGAPPSLSHFSSVEPLAGETALGELELPDSCGILHASFSGGSPLFVFGPGCSDTTPAASFFALGPTGELARRRPSSCLTSPSSSGSSLDPAASTTPSSRRSRASPRSLPTSAVLRKGRRSSRRAPTAAGLMTSPPGEAVTPSPSVIPRGSR
jgi:hypothetical protein